MAQDTRIFEVIEPSLDLSLLTIDELREAAGVTDDSQDDKLARLGLRAATAIARACCIKDDGVNPPTLLHEWCQEKIDCVSGSELRLMRRPVTSVLSLTIGGVEKTVADFELNKAAGRLSYRPGGVLTAWPSGRVVVDYDAGFEVAPDDLKDAASRLVAAFNAALAKDPDLKRENIPGVREVEYWVGPKDDPLMSADVTDALAPYVEHWL